MNIATGKLMNVSAMNRPSQSALQTAGPASSAAAECERRRQEDVGREGDTNTSASRARRPESEVCDMSSFAKAAKSSANRKSANMCT